MQVTGKKKPPVEGEDGRLYYNFALHSKYKINKTVPHGMKGDCIYEISDMQYVNDTEYYDVLCDGELKKAISANRLVYLLDFGAAELIQQGEMCELPLLPFEVSMFYNSKGAAQRAEQKKAKQLIAADIEWKKLNETLQAKPQEISKALLNGKPAEVASLERQAEEDKRKLLHFLEGKGVNVDLLERQPTCKICYGTGITATGICNCATARADEIKSFCAAERIRLRLKAQTAV